MTTHWKLCWTDIPGHLIPFMKKHLGVGNTPNQTAVMVIACFTHSHTHTHRTRRSKTQLSQYTRTQAGSRHAGFVAVWSFISRHFDSLNTGWLKYLEQGTFLRRVTVVFLGKVFWAGKKGRFIFIISKNLQNGRNLNVWDRRKVRPTTTTAAAKWHCGHNTWAGFTDWMFYEVTLNS